MMCVTTSALTALKSTAIMVPMEVPDEEGNLQRVEVPVTTVTLHIQTSGKTADEMAEEYAFTDAQKDWLSELLKPEYQSMWAGALYGIHNADGQIVAVALSQVGNVGGRPYWSWYGFGGRVEWCACFVSWCAEQCGYIEAGIIPKFAGCGIGADWFIQRGQWADRNYIPQPGDIIFFGKHLGYVCDASLWPVNQALAFSIDIPAHKQKMSEEEKAARREIRAAKRKKNKHPHIRMVDAL